MDQELIPNLIFSSHIWQRMATFHETQQDNFVETLDDYTKHTPSFRTHDQNTFVTNTDLHHNPVFSDLVSQISKDCDRFVEEWEFEVGAKIGISKMWSTIANPGGMSVRHSVPFTFLNGIYFLKTPPDSGDILVENPTVNPDYFNRMPIKTVNSFNAPGFAMAMPEGMMIYLPGNLKIDITNNQHQQDPRYLVHFTLTVL